MGEADLVIGCDAIVSANDEVISKTQAGRTRAVVNTAQTPTADFIKNSEVAVPGPSAEQDIRTAVGEQCEFINASALAVALIGDCHLHQPAGARLCPAEGLDSADAGGAGARHRTERRVGGARTRPRSTGAAIWRTTSAQVLGLTGKPAGHEGADVVKLPTSSGALLEKLIASRVDLLTQYQDAAYAAGYRDAVQARARGRNRLGGRRQAAAADRGRRAQPAPS